jgi:hypothetical protein
MVLCFITATGYNTMKTLFHLFLFPFLALQNMYAPASDEVAEREDLVVFEFSSPSATPSPVSSPSTPRVVTAYETAHLALRGTLPCGSERENKIKDETSKTVVTRHDTSEMEVLAAQLKKHKELKNKQRVQ